jgi:sugar lactone lactonase YvrE
MKLIATLIAFLIQFFLLLVGLRADPSNTLVVDKQGRVYFGDVLHNTVWKIEEGKITPFLKDKHSHRVTLDAQGNLFGEHLEYVPANDSWRFHMWKATPTGEVSYVVPPSSGFPWGLLMDKDGNRYEWHGNVNKQEDSRIVKRAPDGTLTTIAGKGWGLIDGKGEQAKFSKIGGMAWGPDGALYVTDDDAIRRITLDGTVTTIVRGVAELQMGFKARALNLIALGKGGGHLYGLTLDAQGNIYAANFSGKAVIQFAPDGKVLNVIKSENGWAPSGVAVSGGDMYVLEFSDEGATKGPRVRKVTADGRAVTLGTVGESQTSAANQTEPPATNFPFVLKWGIVLLVLLAIAVSGWRVWRHIHPLQQETI